MAGAILSGPVFAAMLHRPPRGWTRYWFRSFTSCSLAPCGAAALAIHNWTHVRGRQILCGVWCGLLAVTAVVHTKELQDSAPANYVADLWHPLPDNAVLIATGDHATAGSWAYNAQRGSAGFTIAADLLAHGWYRRQVNASLGIETVDRGASVDLEEVIRAVQATGRPVFMTSILNPNLARTFPSYPLGLTIAILKPGERPPSIMEVAAQNATLFEAFGYQGPAGHTGPWAETVRAPYAGTWATLAGAFDQMGNVEAATNARLLGKKYEAPHE
ncbi:MAG: hypothetical protein R3E66_10585 [bacterium]